MLYLSGFLPLILLLYAALVGSLSISMAFLGWYIDASRALSPTLKILFPSSSKLIYQLASMYLNFFIMEVFKHKKSRDGNIINLMSHLVPIIHTWQCFSSTSIPFLKQITDIIFFHLQIFHCISSKFKSFKISFNIYHLK